ncbi:MAG: EAL domain-containing protein [Betaproteobacteria bacterium]
MPFKTSIDPGRDVPSPGPVTTFRLTRFFSIASLVGVLVIVAVLVLFYRSLAFTTLQQHETEDNVNIAQIFANTLWRKHADYVKGASTIAKSELQGRPEVRQIREDVLLLMKGLAVVKVKIYNLEGLTVFSTDPAQIGEEKHTNAGFLAAKAGESVSEITFRDRFDAFEQTLNDRSLVSSYTPIRTGPGAPVEAVMEVYSDVTSYVERLKSTAWEIAAGVLASLSVLYLFLLSIVRRAERLIAAQADEVRTANEALLRHSRLHDKLTGLPNRAGFSDLLDGLLRNASRIRQGQKCATLFVNIDKFKDINDSLGHLAGDRILLEVAERVRLSLGDSDDLARIGGDEFAIVLRDISGDRGVERVINTVERVRGAISDRPVVVDGNELVVTACVGISIFPDDGDDMVGLMRSADVALTHAKQIGRNQYQFHTAGMNARAVEVLQVDQDLRRALKAQQFLLHYQPQVDIRTGRITGAEALIRWQHPQRGIVSPGQFISIAEERGLIADIGDWVLRETCRQNKEWQSAGLPIVAMAVNLSAIQFRQNDLAQSVATILREAGPPPQYLELELTESAVMRDSERTIAMMRELKAIGVQLSLDDFGTGYSSLSQLKRFPFDRLKIDQSFVRGLADDPDDLAIVAAIIAMGKALGLTVIAEGVETKAQWDILESLGCAEVQGFFVCKPVPAAEFAQFMQQRGSVPHTS